MPIKWNALMVNEAMNMVEEYVNQAIEPLEQAKLVAIEARKIPNLPGISTSTWSRLISEIERVTGGVLPWNKQPYPGNVRATIKSVRESIPKGMIEARTSEARQRQTTQPGSLDIRQLWFYQSNCLNFSKSKS